MIKTQVFKDKLDGNGGYSSTARSEYEAFLNNNYDLDVIFVQSRLAAAGDIAINQIFLTYKAA